MARRGGRPEEDADRRFNAAAEGGGKQCKAETDRRQGGTANAKSVWKNVKKALEEVKRLGRF